MAEIPQEDPCKECPFRKTSPKGYTGPHENMAEILQLVHFDRKFHCHMRATAILERETHGLESPEGEPDAWHDAEQQAADLTPWCTGALAYMNNTCKEVRDPAVETYADRIGRRNDVFGDPVEAMLYHDGVVRKLMPPGMTCPKVPKKEIEQWLSRKQWQAPAKAKPMAKGKGGRRGR